MLNINEMSRDERRAAKQNIEGMIAEVVSAYNDNDTARETVAELVEFWNYNEAVQMVACVINCVSLADGRVYDGVREWAQSQDAPSNEELHALGFYGVDSWIHSAHVNEIGLAMKKYERPKTHDEIVKEIIEAFEADEDIFNKCIDELDSYNGYLGDDRYYTMDMLDEIYGETEPTEILARAFYGYDETYGSGDNREAFNPNRNYFRFNGYGNLVSNDFRDYSDHIDKWAVESMSENRRWIDSIEDDSKISALFDDLEECEE